MECRFENDFFLGLALRFVKARSRFGLTENVADAVVADTVAGAEIGMRVVVEGAPANAARVLRARGELIVHPGVADGVLTQAFKAIEAFRRISVADEFGIQIARMV